VSELRFQSARQMHHHKHPTVATRALAASLNDPHFIADADSQCRREPVTLEDYNEIQFPVARVKREHGIEPRVIGNVYDIHTLMTCASLNGKYPDSYDIIIWNDIEAIFWTPRRPSTLNEDYTSLTERILDNLKYLETISMHISGTGDQMRDYILSISRNRYCLFRKAMELQKQNSPCPYWVVMYWRCHPLMSDEIEGEDVMDTDVPRHLGGGPVPEDEYRAWRLHMAEHIEKPKDLWYQYWSNHPITDEERQIDPILSQSYDEISREVAEIRFNMNGKRTMDDGNLQYDNRPFSRARLSP
jgi:hypothetical protein